MILRIAEGAAQVQRDQKVKLAAASRKKFRSAKLSCYSKLASQEYAKNALAPGINDANEPAGEVKSA